MSDYFKEADFPSLLQAYPVGAEFMRGPAIFSRDELYQLRESRFLKLMKRGWKVPFYQRLWKKVGLDPGDIETLEDLVKLPTFSKTDLMNSIECFPPYGDYHGVNFNDVRQRPSLVFHTTSGTTGTPQPLFFGARDREIQNILLARAYLLQGLTDKDVVQSVYGFGMVNGGHYVREAVVHFTKALFLSSGTGLETPSAQQVSLMRHFNVSVLLGFADYIKRLAEVARQKGLVPGSDIRIRMISGHLGQEDRSVISDLWGGVDVYDWYGVGDTGIIASEGKLREGLYIWEDAHIVEILCPTELAPISNGKEGNVCITTLFKEDVYPIIRFNTNDVSSMLPPDPESGVNFCRLSGFLGRADNMVKLRGVNVYPSSIGNILDGLDSLNGEYVCCIEREDNRDVMTVIAEVVSGATRTDRLQRLVSNHLREKLGVGVNIELLDSGETSALTQIEMRQKPIRLIDKRR